MFDLTRFVDAFGGPAFFRAADEAGSLLPASLTGLLEAAGIDPNNLSGLSAVEGASLLERYGVDVSQLADDELTQLLEGSSLGALAAAASRFVEPSDGGAN